MNEDVVKGYKGMHTDMTCLGMQYEIGKTYQIDGDIEICRNGLHFCKNLKDVFNYYQRDGSRFFEVEASGIIKYDRDKCVASKLRIIREIPDIVVNRAYYDDGRQNNYRHSSGGGRRYDNSSRGNGFGDGYGFGNGDGCGDGFDDIQKILLFI